MSSCLLIGLMVCEVYSCDLFLKTSLKQNSVFERGILEEGVLKSFMYTAFNMNERKILWEYWMKIRLVWSNLQTRQKLILKYNLELNIWSEGIHLPGFGKYIQTYMLERINVKTLFSATLQTLWLVSRTSCPFCYFHCICLVYKIAMLQLYLWFHIQTSFYSHLWFLVTW